MGIKRDVQGATFAAGAVAASIFFGWWVYSRMGHSNWVILLEAPIAIFGILALSGFADALQMTNRDHKGKKIQ